MEKGVVVRCLGLAKPLIASMRYASKELRRMYKLLSISIACVIWDKGVVLLFKYLGTSLIIVVGSCITVLKDLRPTYNIFCKRIVSVVLE